MLLKNNKTYSGTDKMFEKIMRCNAIEVKLDAVQILQRHKYFLGTCSVKI